MPRSRPRVRRGMPWLAVFGVCALLAAWPLFHVTRVDRSGCRTGMICEPTPHLPFGSLAVGLTFAGLLALMVVAVWLSTTLIRGVIRHDVRIRATHRR
jgi:hypothetical protein